MTEERALREAAAVDAADRRGGTDPGVPLAGVPVGWKDLIDTAGDPNDVRERASTATTCRERDADVVARIAPPAAITVAKLATHELAWGTTTDNPHFGSCRNPHDPTRVPGGSSGGSGVGAGGGHRRRWRRAPTPAARSAVPPPCCGIVGLKPTFGRVSLAGVQPLCPTLDHCGPMARSVRDCALMLEAAGRAVAGRPADAAGAGGALPRRPWPTASRGRRSASPSASSSSTPSLDVAAPVRAAVEALTARPGRAGRGRH